MRNKIGTMAIILTVFFCGTAAADEAAVSDAEYAAGVEKKLSRGATNAGFGWMELPKTIDEVGSRTNNGFAAATVGVVQGTGKALVRTVAGFCELTTFLLPARKDARPMVEPEYVLDETPATE